MSRRTTTTRISKVSVLLAACALAASLSSCGRSDPVQAEIDRVSVGLNAISTSGSSALQSVEHRKAVYQWAVDRMSGRSSARDPIATEIARPAGTMGTSDPGRPQKIVSDVAAPSVQPIQATNTGQAAAANLLLARGYGGLGEIAAQEAAQLEAGATLRIPPISAALDQWLAQNAAADALEVYDPATDIAAIERQIGEKQKLADAARANKDQQLAKVADLEKRAADLMASTRTLREQAAEVRGRATSVSETVRLELITEAVRIGREADEIEKQASLLLAQVDLEKPKADTLQRSIDELTTQMQLHRTDKDNLRQRADQRGAAAKRARDEARSAATRLTQMLGALATTREGLTEPTAAAVNAYEKAVSAARKAGQVSRENKGQAAIAAGNYQHALADVLATQARGQKSYADLLATLAAAKPALPGAADLASKSAAAAEASNASLKAAREAFEAALSQYSSAGGSGDTQDRLKALENAMNAILGKQPAMEGDVTPPSMDADAATPAAVPAMADSGASEDMSAVEAEVRAAVEQFIAATKSADFAVIRGFMFIRDEAARPAFEAIMDVAAGPAALEASCQKAYGKSLKQLIDESSVQSIKTNPMLAGMQQGMDQLSMSGMSFDDLTADDGVIVPVSATEATVTFPSEVDGEVGQVFTLVKDGGSWKVDMESQLEEMGGAAALRQMAPMLAPMKAMGSAFTLVAGKLDGGGYADADTMLIDLNKELMAAMMKAGGLGNPGGG